MDVIRRLGDDGSRDHAGFFAGAGYAEGDVDHVFGGRAGTMSLDAYSFGAYWTHFGSQGWYLNALVQGTRFADVEMQSVLGQGLSTEGWGAAASLEAGYPIALGNDFVLEPQAQIIYQRVSLDNGADAFSQVSFEDSDSYLGRVGARLSRTFALNESNTPRLLTTWVRANLWHGFGDDPKTTFSSTEGLNPATISAGQGGTWAQIGIGASGQVTDNVALFATGDYDFSVDGGESEGWSGRLGMKVVW
jgi:outer membrane autotransporter protein